MNREMINLESALFRLMRKLGWDLRDRLARDVIVIAPPPHSLQQNDKLDMEKDCSMETVDL